LVASRNTDMTALERGVSVGQRRRERFASSRMQQTVDE
jgi:hypothetical protein